MTRVPAFLMRMAPPTQPGSPAWSHTGDASRNRIKPTNRLSRATGLPPETTSNGALVWEAPWLVSMAMECQGYWVSEWVACKSPNGRNFPAVHHFLIHQRIPFLFIDWPVRHGQLRAAGRSANVPSPSGALTARQIDRRR